MKTPDPCRRFLLDPWSSTGRCFWCNWIEKDHFVHDELPEVMEFEITYWETLLSFNFPEDWPDN